MRKINIYKLGKVKYIVQHVPSEIQMCKVFYSTVLMYMAKNWICFTPKSIVQ